MEVRKKTGRSLIYQADKDLRKVRTYSPSACFPLPRAAWVSFPGVGI